MKSIESICIDGRKIGPGCPAFIVAEVSANHGQKIEKAESIIRAAKQAGADAVKLQTYTADTLTIPCDNKYFKIKGTLWDGRTLHDLYQEAYTPWDWHTRLKDVAREEGLIFFSTPFDDSAVDFLESLKVPAHKIASFEIVDIPLLRRVAQTAKPIILSTGMASLSEIDEAVTCLRENGCKELILLKCTSAYPAPCNGLNLNTIPHLSEAYGVPAGLSDHTMGMTAAVVSVTLGASMIEKHFTLRRSDGGPDSAFSMEPIEFRAMVDAVRDAEQAVGEVSYAVSPREISSKVFRRSLFVVKETRAGEPFTPENVRSIRPGYGLSPRHYDHVLASRATRDIERGTPLTWDMVGGR